MPFIGTTLHTLVANLASPSSYRDHQYEVPSWRLSCQGTDEDFARDIQGTCTLYVGNLSFYTTEEQIYEFFGKIAPIKRLVMGLDRTLKTPCGFCFVEYFDREAAVLCKVYLNGMKLDERFVRVDFDPGFKDGRQFGRGRRGGQVARLFYPVGPRRVQGGLRSRERRLGRQSRPCRRQARAPILRLR